MAPLNVVARPSDLEAKSLPRARSAGKISCGSSHLFVSGSAAGLIRSEPSRPSSCTSSSSRIKGRQLPSSCPSSSSSCTPSSFIGVGPTIGNAFSSVMDTRLQECTSLESLQQTGMALASRLAKQPVAQQALAAATTRQCCKLLQRGWETMQDATASVSALSGLQKQKLLVVVGNVQLAVAAAFAGLLKGAGVAFAFRSQTHTRDVRVPPGDAFALRAPVADVEQRLQVWLEHAQLFCEVVEAGLLLPDDVTKTEGFLEIELKRGLHGATLKHLQHSADLLRLGGICLTRGIAFCDDATVAGADSILEVASVVSTIVGEALHAAEVSSPAGKDSASGMARMALQEAGLLDYDQHGRQAQPEPEPDIDLKTPKSAESCQNRTWPQSESDWQSRRPCHRRVGVPALNLELRCTVRQELAPSTASALDGGLRQVQAARVEIKRLNSMSRQKKLPVASITPSHQLSLRRRPYS